MRKNWIKFIGLCGMGTLPACNAVLLGSQRFCFARQDVKDPGLSALVRLTLSGDGRVTGDGYGSLYKPEHSYAADYRQTFVGSLQSGRLSLTVITKLYASRSDVEGYPAQTQETWLLSPQQVTPLISKIPLTKMDCTLVDATLRESGQWFDSQ
jgi:hypothetical protein